MSFTETAFSGRKYRPDRKLFMTAGGKTGCIPLVDAGPEYRGTNKDGGL